MRKWSKYHLEVYKPHYADLYDHREINFYDPKTVGDAANENVEPLYTYHKKNNLLNYSEGPTFNLMEIEGSNYYVSTFYEKPFVANEDQQNPEWEKNNKFVIEFYDTSFNLVKTVKLPLIGQDKHEISMSCMNAFDNYMISSHIFNNDDKMEFVYGMSRYYTECDCEKVDYYLVNEDGEILKEIVQQVGGVIKLQNIANQSDEYALLMGGGDAITDIKMLRMPTMEDVYSFPALHNGELLSLNFERIAVGDSYNYIFGLGRGENADNTVYGGIVYYDQDP